uniref:Uncharacterized protein n=1 Tax=Rangifer tarandus platyrhynchus TaxID=3082113 RepID=A0ACB0ENH3_RANTA|nr:unnamed protein product [Rangifer tarandus platyrhynchus]
MAEGKPPWTEQIHLPRVNSKVGAHSLSHWLAGRCVQRPHTWHLTSEFLLQNGCPDTSPGRAVCRDRAHHPAIRVGGGGPFAEALCPALPSRARICTPGPASREPRPPHEIPVQQPVRAPGPTPVRESACSQQEPASLQSAMKENIFTLCFSTQLCLVPLPQRTRDRRTLVGEQLEG